MYVRSSLSTASMAAGSRASETRISILIRRVNGGSRAWFKKWKEEGKVSDQDLTSFLFYVYVHVYICIYIYICICIYIIVSRTFTKKSERKGANAEGQSRTKTRIDVKTTY